MDIARASDEGHNSEGGKESDNSWESDMEIGEAEESNGNEALMQELWKEYETLAG
jgi:hypothetical protein